MCIPQPEASLDADPTRSSRNPDLPTQVDVRLWKLGVTKAQEKIDLTARSRIDDLDVGTGSSTPGIPSVEESSHRLGPKQTSRPPGPEALRAHMYDLRAVTNRPSPHS